ncbi:glycosyltransferase family 4 protein [Niallia sp. JL1B1071]|uniref:glycosyltransferase family 4 protein n=1 Tax=Niallia tiangongensis TaxID=3237105 RepID=UPI0037DBF81F
MEETMRKRILFISDYSFNVPGGAQKSMEIIMQGLSSEFEFYVIMPGEKYEYKESYKIIFLEDFDNLLINENVIKSSKILFDLMKQINIIKPNVIHTHMVSSMSGVGLLKWLKLLKNIQLIYTERGVPSYYSKINQFVIKYAIQNFSKIITTTNINRKKYLEMYSAPKDKVTTIPNTAGPLFDIYDSEKETSIKKAYGYSKKVVMFNGRYTDDKNWSLAKEIIKYLTSKFDYSFVVVLGSDKSEEDIKKCKKLIGEIESIVGKRNIISFIDLSLLELSDLYYLSDIFILTSNRESFGRTAVEAMSRKSTVFGTDIDGLAEVINFNDYKYKNLQDFVDKFTKFQEKDIEVEKERFYKRYVDNFSGKINIDLHREIYENQIFKK